MAENRLDIVINAARAISGASKVDRALKLIATSAAKTEKALKALENVSVTIKVDAKGLNNLGASIKTVEKALKSISAKSIKVRVDTSGLDKLKLSSVTADKSLKAIAGSTIKPKVSLVELNALKSASVTARNALDSIGTKIVKPKVDASSLEKLKASSVTAAKALASVGTGTIKPVVDTTGLNKLRDSSVEAARALSSISTKSIAPKVSMGDLDRLRIAVVSMDKRLSAINTRVVRPQVDASAFRVLVNASSVVSKELAAISTKVVNPRVNAAELKTLAAAATAANTALQSISKKTVNIKVNAGDLRTLASSAAAAEKALAALTKRDLSIRVNATGFAALESSIRNTERLISTIQKSKITVQADISALGNLTRALSAVQSQLRDISKTRIVPEASLINLSGLNTVVKNVKVALEQISKVKVAPRVDSGQLTKLGSQLKTLQAQLSALSKQRLSIVVDAKSFKSVEGSAKAAQDQIKLLTSTAKAMGSAFGSSATAAVRALNSITTSANAAATAVNRVRTAAANLKGAAATLAATTKAAAAASTAVGGLSLANARGSSSAGIFGRSLSGVASLAVTAARAMGLLVGTVAAFGVSLADSSIQITNRLKLVTSTSSELVKVQGELFRQARDARVSLSAQAELYQRIGLSAKELNATTLDVLASTEAVAKAITLSASSTQAANATIIQFGQALAFGKLRGDELRSVLEQAPRLATALADGLGIARGELVKFGFAGQLTSEKVFNALLTQLPKLREEFALLTPRIGEAAKVLQNSFINLFGTVNDITGVFDGVSKGILNLADEIKDSTPEAINGLTDAKIGIQNLEKQIQELREETAKPGFGFSLLERLSEQGSKFLDALGPVGDGVRAFGDEVDTLKSALVILPSLLDGVTESVAGINKLEVKLPDGGKINLAPTGIEELDDARVKVNELVRSLNDVTETRRTLQLKVNAGEAQKEVEDFKVVIEGEVIESRIKTFVDAAQAREQLAGLGDDAEKLSQDLLSLTVQLDFPEANKTFDYLLEQLDAFEDKGSEAAKTIAADIERLRPVIEQVRKDSSQIIATDETKAAIDAIRKEMVSLGKEFPEVFPLGSNRQAGTGDDLRGEEALGKGIKEIDKFIDAQERLLVTLTTVEGVERDISILRLKAGKEATAFMQDQLDATAALVNASRKLADAQEELSDFADDAEKEVAALQKKVDAVNEVTASQRILNKLQETDTLTDSEQTRLVALKDRLRALKDIEGQVNTNIDVTSLLAEIESLSGKLTPEQRERLDALSKEAAISEDLIALNKEREDAEKKAEKAAEDAASNRAQAHSANLSAIKSFVDQQKRLIIELQTVEGVERELALLRFETSAGYVANVEDQIRANDALITGLERKRIAEEEAAKAVGEVDAYIVKQQELLISLTTVAGAERDLLQLRLSAGDAAVNAQKAQIEAYQLLINAVGELKEIQDQQGTYASTIDKEVEKLQKELDLIGALTLDQIILNKLREADVRTDAEEARLAILNEQIRTGKDLNGELLKEYELRNLIAEAMGLQNQLSQEQFADLVRQRERARLLNIELELERAKVVAIEDSTKATERQIKASEKARDLAGTVIRNNLPEDERARFDLSLQRGQLQAEQTRLLSIPEADRNDQDLSDLKEISEALEIVTEDFNAFGSVSAIALEKLKELAAGVAKAMEGAFSTFFFDIMQSNFKDLTKNLKDNFKNAVDRMVADALAAQLAAKLAQGFTGFGTFLGSIFGGGGGLLGGGAPAAVPAGAKGLFAKPFETVEVNESGQELLMLKSRELLIPDAGTQINRSSPMEMRTRGMAKGGFAKPNELVQINEMGLESIITRGGSFMTGEASDKATNDVASPAPVKGISEPKIFHYDNRTFMQMGAAGGFVIPADKTQDIISKKIDLDSVPGREFGGAVQSRSVFEVNEGVLPELLSIGSRDFLLTGGASGYVSPMDSDSELGRSVTVNMTVVSPDVDGFRKSQSQIQNDLGRLASTSTRRNG